MLTVELPEDVENRLEALARAKGRTKALYAREVIIEHIGDLEDLHLAEFRLSEIEARRSKTIPLDEVMRRYGLDD